MDVVIKMIVVQLGFFFAWMQMYHKQNKCLVIELQCVLYVFFLLLFNLYVT